MATLKKIDDTGLTLYAVLRDVSLQLWNTATEAMEAFNAANYTDYDVAATEQGSTGFYSITSPATLPVGAYSVDWRSQQTGTPAQSDSCVGLLSAYWDGTAWFPDWAIKLAQSAAPVTDSPEKNIKVAAADVAGLDGDAMRGTDSAMLAANYVAPDNTGIGNTLAKATAAASDAATIKGKLPAEGAQMHAAGAAVAKSPATLAAGDIAENAIDANSIKADAVTRIATGIWTVLTSTLTAAGSIGKYILDSLAAVGGTGTGARAITVTVTDGTSSLEGARVRFTNGTESYVGSTDVDGTVVFSLDDKTWTAAITKSGYLFTPTTLVVSANASITYAITAVVVPASDPGLVTGYLYCYDEEMAAEEGVVVQLKIQSVGTGDGVGYDTAIRSETSDANGLVTFTNLVPEATYSARRGDDSDWTEITIPAGAADPYALDNLFGEDV